MCVNKTNFHMKGFALGLTFETEAKCNSEIAYLCWTLFLLKLHLLEVQ